MVDHTSPEAVHTESSLPSGEPLCTEMGFLTVWRDRGRGRRFQEGVFPNENGIHRSLKESTSELNSRTFTSFCCWNSS